MFIDGDPRAGPTAGSCQSLGKTLLKKNVDRILVFANTEDQGYFGAFFGGFRNSGVACMPQLLSDLAYSILTTTVVYLEFREAITWKWTNYLWERGGAA